MGLSIVRPEEVAGRGELAISVMPLNILLRLVITAEKSHAEQVGALLVLEEVVLDDPDQAVAHVVTGSPGRRAPHGLIRPDCR